MDLNFISHFIGRHDEREQIKELLITKDIQVLQIYGLPSTGKTELIRQVCREIHCELPESRSIYRNITTEQWLTTEIRQFLKDIKNSKMLSLIVLDSFQNLSKTKEFCEFCLETLWNIPHLKIILIFQGFFPLKIDGISNEQIQLKPMNKTDARSLFYRKTNLVLDDKSDQQVDELIDYCGGLPGQIVEFTNKISQIPTNTPLAKVYKFVKENKSFCQSKDTFVKINRHVESLPTKQRCALSEVVYFPGAFSTKDITKMTNYKDDLDTEFSFVYPLLGHGLLKTTDENNEEFQVSRLFQDYAQMYLGHLRHEDTTKLKFSAIIGKTLIEAENLWEEGLIYEALGIMKSNWENVQKLFQQAIHSPSDGNSFQIYYKVMVDASNILSLCYPNEAKLFCRAIFDNAQIFGSELQRALSMASYGHTLVESSQKEALQLYQQSEEILRKHNHSYQLIILLYQMSNAYYHCGKLHKGIRCAEEALSIQVIDRDSTEIQHVRTYAATNLGYNLIFATEYGRAEEIVQQTLQEMGESGHPSVPTLLNLLGLKEERSKGDLNRALTWYLASLSKKRKIAKFQEPLLVPTLCNVAGQLSKTKRKHYFALRFLYEAESIRRRAGWFHNYSALVLWNIGMVYMRQHNYVDALLKIQEAEKLYETVNFSHYVNAEVKVWLSHCHILLGNAEDAKQILLEVVRNGPIYHKYRPQGEFVLNALEHLIHLSILDRKEQQSYTEELLKELSRLNSCPGVCAISSGKYLQLRLKYTEILVKIINNNAKKESHPGIFLTCIPDTCLACLEVINYDMCPKNIYLQKMNYLTSICQLSNRTVERSAAHREPQEQNENKCGSRDTKTSTTIRQLSDRTATRVAVLREPQEQNENKYEKRDTETSTTTVNRNSKEMDNVSILKSENFNSDILPLPVKELCQNSIPSSRFPKTLTTICQLSDKTAAKSSVYRKLQEHNENKYEKRDTETSTTTVNRTSKEMDNVSILKSESMNSDILPLPVKELCQNMESGRRDTKTPTTICQLSDRTAAKSAIHRELQEQNKNKCGRNDTKTSTTIVSRNSKEINNVSILKSESLNSDILPLPVKELCQNMESVGPHQEVSNGFPDFDALFSLKENSAGCKNKSVHPELRADISKIQNNTIKTISQNGETKCFTSNLTGQSPRLFGENEQLWELKNSTKIQQTPKDLAETHKDARADTRYRNVGTKFFDYSKSPNVGTKTDQKFQPFLGSQEIIEDSKTKEKPIVRSQWIPNKEEPNRLQIINSNLSNAKNGQRLANGSQNQILKIIQEQQKQEHFWKNHKGSQCNSSTKTESPKTNEATNFSCFKEERTNSKISKDLSKYSPPEKPFSTIPIERQLLNFPSPKIHPNLPCTNDNSAKTQQNISDVRSQINEYKKKTFSQLTSKTVPMKGRGREPVEHDEKLD